MWSCPKCASTVDDGFAVCWNCGTSKQGEEDPNFVRADAVPPIQDPRYDPVALPDDSIRARWITTHGDPEDELVACYQAGSLPEAKFLADELGRIGVPAVSDMMDLQDALGVWSGNPRVYCRAGDVEKARAFLEEYDRRQEEKAG
jgi:pentatricopeptide repeat protein